jgi:zinc protease
VADRRHLRLLAGICEDRLRVQIRDALGATYSPTAGVDFSDTYPGFADIHCQLDVKPDQERKIAGLVNRVASDLAAHGITDDELQRAKAQAGAQSREAAYGDDYWLDAVMADCQERPERLDEARTLQGDFMAAAKPEIDALAARYLRENNLFQFVIRAQQRSTK